MLNIILTTKPSKQRNIERFIRSRGIVNFVTVFDSQELYDCLLTNTCNLHIFDYHRDMSIINIIRDLRDNANSIRVYVTSIEHAKPYLALTDDIFVLPDEFNAMSFFWDSEACNIRNVMAFNTMGIDFCKIQSPTKTGSTKKLFISIAMKDVPLRYKTADGRVVNTKGPQLTLACRSKAIDLSRLLKTRDQSKVYKRTKPDLSTLPDSPVEEEQKPLAEPETPKPKKEPNPPKPPKPKKEPKPPKPPKPKKEPPVKDVHFKADKKLNGFSEITADVEDAVLEVETEEQKAARAEALAEVEAMTKRTEAIAEDTKTETVKEPESEPEIVPKAKRKVAPAPISFGDFAGGGETRSTALQRRKFTITTSCDSIAQYCLENNYISKEDHDELMKRIQSNRNASRDAQFGDQALSRGLITEEQLIKAISSINSIEVLPWELIEPMELDFSFFSIEKCLEYKFFKIKTTRDTESVQLVASTSISNLNSEVKRLFDNPRIRYTLDTFITKKLEGYK